MYKGIGNCSITEKEKRDLEELGIVGKLMQDVKVLAVKTSDGKNVFENSDESRVPYVIIFALPSQVTSGDCMSDGLLGYRTLDPENSHYLIDDQRNADIFNSTKTGLDFVKLGFISKNAIQEIENVGGTVVVFVVTKDIANDELGYKVGTNFFMEDPIGWSMIFVAALSMIWPACRIFIKKKVRVI